MEATSVLIRIVCLNSIVGNIAKALPVYVSIKYDLWCDYSGLFKSVEVPVLEMFGGLNSVVVNVDTYCQFVVEGYGIVLS